MFYRAGMNLHRRDVLSIADGFVRRFGLNPAVGSSYETIWNGGGDYNFDVVGTPKISSSSAADAAAGTGVRTMRIFGLVSGVEEYEDVTLNGQTQVALTKAFTSIYLGRALTAGSGKTNAGDIYCNTGAVVAGVPSDATKTHFKMPIGTSQTHVCVYRIPAGRVGYILDWWVAQGESNDAYEAQLCTFDSVGNVIVAHSDTVGIEERIADSFDVPIRVEAGNDIFIRAKSLGAGTAAMSAHFELALSNV
jgi:hypothetical protein